MFLTRYKCLRPNVRLWLARLCWRRRVYARTPAQIKTNTIVYVCQHRRLAVREQNKWCRGGVVNMLDLILLSDGEAANWVTAIRCVGGSGGCFPCTCNSKTKGNGKFKEWWGVGVEQCSGLKMNPSGTSTQQGHLKFRSFPDWDRRMAERARRGSHETSEGASRGSCNANPLIAELRWWGALG